MTILECQATIELLRLRVNEFFYYKVFRIHRTSLGYQITREGLTGFRNCDAADEAIAYISGFDCGFTVGQRALQRKMSEGLI